MSRCSDSSLPLPLYFDVFYTMSGKNVAEQKTAAFILSAQNTLCIAMYNFDSKPVLDAILTAKSRGVKIKIVGDYNEQNTQGYQDLRKYNIDLVAGNNTGIQHNKFIVVDSDAVLTGTGNFTQSGFYHNNNNFLIIHNTALAQIYTEEFLRLYEGAFGKVKSPPYSKKMVTISNVPVRVYFSPYDSHEAVSDIIESIDNARQSVHYMIFAFSHDEIAAALIRAAKRGVKVYGLHDSNFIRGVSQSAPRLYRASRFLPSLEVRKDGNESYLYKNGYASGSKMHCKTMLIDAKTDNAITITGSFNWSENAMENNDENLLIIKNNAVTQRLLNQWKLSWIDARDMHDTFPVYYGSISPANRTMITEIAWFGLQNGNPDDRQKFIEIKNISAETLDLSNWSLGWSSGGQRYYTFGDVYSSVMTEPVTLLPGEYLIIRTPGYHAFQSAFAGIKTIELPDSADFNPSAQTEFVLYDPVMNIADRTGPLPLPQEALKPSVNFPNTVHSWFRSGSEGNPVWLLSESLCGQCNNSHLFATPAGPELYSNRVKLIRGRKLDTGRVELNFSGDVGSCTNSGDYEIKEVLAGNSPGLPVIDNITSGEYNNRLLFQVSGVSPNGVYTISPKTDIQGPVISLAAINSTVYAGTKDSLYISHDYGATFAGTVLGVYPSSVNDVLIDGQFTYAGTSDGIYISVSQGPFQKIINSPANVRQLAADGQTLWAASLNGLYKYSAGAFQKILPQPFLFVAANSGAVIAAAGEYAYYSGDGVNFSVTNIPMSIQGVEFIGADIYAATISGLYLSASGAAFNLAGQFTYPENYLFLTQNGSFYYVFSKSNIIAVEASKTGLLLPLYENKPVKPLSAAASQDHLYVGTTSGLYISNDRGRNFTYHEKYCSSGPANATLPSGGFSFSGFSAQPEASAVLQQVMLTDATNSPTWIKFYIVAGGSLKSMYLSYYQGHSQERIFRFPEMEANTGDIIHVIFSAAEYSRYWFNSDEALPLSGLTFYGMYNDFSFSDAVFVLNRNNQWLDALYYTNRDGFIEGSMIRQMRRFYSGVEAAYFLPFRYIYPVQGLNDTIIQNRGAELNPGDGLLK